MSNLKGKASRLRRDFFFEEYPIGYFQGEVYPSSNGCYAYTPYRGEGHALMAKKLKSGETISAWFLVNEERRAVTIVRESFRLDRNERWQVQIEFDDADKP